MIVRSRTVAPFGENAYLAGCSVTGAAVLIDPGGEVPALLEEAEAEGLQIEAVWLTHAHVDHVIGVAEAVERTGVPVWLHPEDLFLYEAAAQQGAAFGVRVPELPEPEGRLRAGDELQLGELAVRVLHVPGHSPGHVAFHVSTAAALFSGDCVFAGSIGRTDLPGGDSGTLLASIRERILTLGDEVQIFPGHGPTTTVGTERRQNPFLAAG